MSRLTETIPASPSSPSPVEQNLAWLKGKITCPFCGTVTERADEACARCGMNDTPANRDATKARIGPWYVLQSRNPAAPGMTYATLMLLVKKELVNARSIVRGPTTHQLWAFAATVRGLSREFGLCWSCGARVDKASLSCAACSSTQRPPNSGEDLIDRGDAPPLPDAPPTDDTTAPGVTSRPMPSTSMDIVLPTPGDNFSDARASVSDARSSVSDLRSSAFEGPPGALQTTARPRPRNGRILSDEQLNAPRRHAVAYPGDGRWRKAMQGVGLLILSTLAVLGFAMLVFPDFRHHTLRRASDVFDPVMDRWRAWGENADPGARERNAPLDPLSEIDPAAPVRPPVVGGKDEFRLTDPPALPDVPASGARPSGASALIDDRVTQDLVRTLMQTAANLEQKGDYAGALRAYEQVKSTPQRFWPNDLREREGAVRERVPVE